eukprot:239951-Pelagomonas_calceolata.AAC.1
MPASAHIAHMQVHSSMRGIVSLAKETNQLELGRDASGTLICMRNVMGVYVCAHARAQVRARRRLHAHMQGLG